MISIHAPLTGSDPPDKEVTDSQDISIHAPLTGSDQALTLQDIKNVISIHAPLTGSDLVALFHLLCGLYFNPRSPYGERLC